MDFQGSSIYIGARADDSAPSWPAWCFVVEAGETREEPLTAVASYAEAEGLARSTGAERVFVPADVLADMVRAGAGPG